MAETPTTLEVYESDKIEFNRMKMRHYLGKKLRDVPNNPDFFHIMMKAIQEKEG